jgi:hypothetical protein
MTTMKHEAMAKELQALQKEIQRFKIYGILLLLIGIFLWVRNRSPNMMHMWDDSVEFGDPSSRLDSSPDRSSRWLKSIRGILTTKSLNT